MPARADLVLVMAGLDVLGKPLDEENVHRPEQVAALALPERLDDAVAEARRLTSFGARRRQVQYIGKLMRQLDEVAVAAIRTAVTRK